MSDFEIVRAGLDEYDGYSLERAREDAHAALSRLRARLEAAERVAEAADEYLAPSGAQWYIDCNERTHGKNYPGKASLARVIVAAREARA